MFTLKGKTLAYRSGSKWFVGKANKSSITQTAEIKKLADVPDVKNYVTLLQFLKLSDIKSEEAQEFQETFLKKTKTDRIYVKLEQEEVPDKDTKNYLKKYENWYWSEYNELCKSCKGKCKQSWQVDIYVCNRYNKGG
jgi:hypothetical protein